jgi:hypothetical protein
LKDPRRRSAKAGKNGRERLSLSVGDQPPG